MENNKLIAEFMGFQQTSIGWYDAEEYLHEKDNTFDTLKFDVDWNWLMPVVEKILDISLDLDSMEMYYNITDAIPKIESTYNEVVEFIKWYNKNK
jgi:hypothetical protein